MKKIYLISSILLLVTLTSCSYLKQENENIALEENNLVSNEMYKSEMMDEKIMDESDWDNQDEMMDKQKIMWIYTDYDMSKLTQDKDNILFFHAWWCPACVKANKNFESQEIPENLNILKVDYDNSSDLKKKYWVKMQHTFVLVNESWEMLKQWSGSSDIMDLENQIK